MPNGLHQPSYRSFPLSGLCAGGDMARSWRLLRDGDRGLPCQRCGRPDKALAGAGVASSKDATAASLNPAGLVNVENQINVSVSALKLNGGFSSAGSGGIDPDGHHDSEQGLLVIPNLAATWRVNWGFVDAVALTAYANGGVNTRYKDIVNPACGGRSRACFAAGHWELNSSRRSIRSRSQRRSCREFRLALHPLSPSKRASRWRGSFAAFQAIPPISRTAAPTSPGVLAHAAA